MFARKENRCKIYVCATIRTKVLTLHIEGNKRLGISGYDNFEIKTTTKRDTPPPHHHQHTHTHTTTTTGFLLNTHTHTHAHARIHTHTHTHTHAHTHARTHTHTTTTTPAKVSPSQPLEWALLKRTTQKKKTPKNSHFKLCSCGNRVQLVSDCPGTF